MRSERLRSPTTHHTTPDHTAPEDVAARAQVFASPRGTSGKPWLKPRSGRVPSTRPRRRNSQEFVVAEPTTWRLTLDRIRTAGMFFVEGDRKFFARGVSYGPFSPRLGEPFPEKAQVESDFARLRAF